MSIHQVDSICPLCSTVTMVGHADMSEHQLKYICPNCSARHYGEPEQTGLDYVCVSCKETSDYMDWKKVPLSANEHILGPVRSCSKCNAQLEAGNIAFIETENGTFGESGRTGRLFFLKPDEKFLASIGSEKAVYIEKAALEKMIKPGGEDG